MKVVDFGIVRGDSAVTATMTVGILGTPAYISPEHAQGAAVDARSDVYSLGCVLYEMLVGQRPFDGDTAVAVATAHVLQPDGLQKRSP